MYSRWKTPRVVPHVFSPHEYPTLFRVRTPIFTQHWIVSSRVTATNPPRRRTPVIIYTQRSWKINREKIIECPPRKRISIEIRLTARWIVFRVKNRICARIFYSVNWNILIVNNARLCARFKSTAFFFVHLLRANSIEKNVFLLNEKMLRPLVCTSNRVLCFFIIIENDIICAARWRAPIHNTFPQFIRVARAIFRM